MNTASKLDLMRCTDKASLLLDNPEELRSLRIWYCKYKSLVNIQACTNLEELVIAGFPDDNFVFFESFLKLKYLRIMHFPKVSALEGLKSLRSLEVLSLSTTPSWDTSGKRIYVHTLKPIASLPKIKHLELFRVCPESLSLTELEDCSSLQSVRASGYPKSEIKRFLSVTSLKDCRAPLNSFD